VKYLLLIISFVFISCGEVVSTGSDATSSNSEDLTDKVFSSRDENCEVNTGSYTSDVSDINNAKSFNGSLVISENSSSCTLTTNHIPNHDFNDGTTSFPNDVAEVSGTYVISKSPSQKGTNTQLEMAMANIIFLNGAIVDTLPAACYGRGSGSLGHEKIGCNDLSYAWRYDPMYSGNDFGTDTHNAHAQPDGTYHYHGSPEALYNSSGSAESGLIGFAADGFPVYGPYIDDGGSVRLVVSGFRLIDADNNGSPDARSLTAVNSYRTSMGLSSLSEDESPGGTFDGTYRDDYEYVAGLGDLDECNGMTRNGVYGYYITTTYPWVLNCFKGTVDSSF
jgi:hypothetical protein